MFESPEDFFSSRLRIIMETEGAAAGSLAHHRAEIYLSAVLRFAEGGPPQLEFSSILGEDGLPTVLHLHRLVMLVGLGGTRGWFGGVQV